MKRTGKVIGGVFLVLIGASMLFGMLGIHLGGLASVVIGALLLYWGYAKWQEKDELTFTSILLMGLGGIVLFGGIGGVISLAIAALFIYGGYRLLKRHSDDADLDFEADERPTTRAFDSIDDEFARMMKKYD
ncbi:LiaF transmembrane domain-containing protein [Halalkalibacterium ligniniphilum]|uniref:LiaF transmembrane domain-containing protein n=1 Tax=Halalkalibacterium ligniniphilum TaxID=1134413 RepID=UPI00034B4180|nr:hypothetical protein [Halalkalibacterium ligniniphilum]